VDKNVLNKPVHYVKRIGPRRARLLEKMGIFTLGDLFYHFPRQYEDRTHIQPAHRFPHDSKAIIKGTVVGSQDLKPRKNLIITKVGVHDGTAIFYAVWFNQPYIKKQLRPGTGIIVTGKMDRSFGVPQVHVNDFDVFSERQPLLNSNRIVPVYPLTGKLGQRAMRQIVYGALQDWLAEIDEFLPPYILEKYDFPSLSEAIHNIHFPGTMEEAHHSRRRFIFEELFMLQLGLALKRKKNALQKKRHRYSSDAGLTGSFMAQLPFHLTEAQKRVWNEISGDMDAPYPMNRLLQGDVGSGKTIISALALLKAAESGFQGALMAPTEILAEQHFLNLQNYMAPVGVNVALVSGGMNAKEKSRVLDEIASGHVRVVVGTHAIIQETVQFAELSLVVVDEQHRFGVRQRATLQYKGLQPDVLVMTATPIPRTLAMTIYGDLDISVIDEMPPGRQSIKTYAVKPSALDKVYKLIHNEITAGHQAYVVCALVEESEKLDVRPAVETAAYLQNEVFSAFNVGLIHGRMGTEEKEEVMASFRKGHIDILVATSVIEVGVDVSNATVMVILDAHRFGLAQLHQLRGRVGRGNKQSFCILVAEPSTSEARERLRAMTLTTDGFRLAEMDLKIRGPGDFFGTRQSGIPELKIADPVANAKIMHMARNEAASLLAGDPALEKPLHKLLLAEMIRRFNTKENFIEIS